MGATDGGRRGFDPKSPRPPAPEHPAEPAAEAWTVGRLLQWTAEFLKAHAAEAPRLDAEVLLAHALGCRRIELYTAFEETPGEERRAAFRELVRRRADGTPVAYSVGRREFYSLSFRVGPEVLIPRPETELLVIALLDLAKSRAAGAALRIADVGTGSGVIAICAAKHLPGCRVTALDASPAALSIAAANAAEHGVANRIEWLESDLLAAAPPGRRFDYVVSNPPYVNEAEFARLAPEVKNFEPRQALVAGPLGVEVIQRLVPQAADRLDLGGHFLVEISPMIHQSVCEIVSAEPRLELGPTVKDLARHPRVVVARRK